MTIESPSLTTNNCHYSKANSELSSNQLVNPNLFDHDWMESLYNQNDLDHCKAIRSKYLDEKNVNLAQSEFNSQLTNENINYQEFSSSTNKNISSFCSSYQNDQSCSLYNSTSEDYYNKWNSFVSNDSSHNSSISQ